MQPELCVGVVIGNVDPEAAILTQDDESGAPLRRLGRGEGGGGEGGGGEGGVKGILNWPLFEVRDHSSGAAASYGLGLKLS